MADDYSNYDWGNLGLWGGPASSVTTEIDPEQFARQGAYPVDLSTINTMASGGPSGSTNYGVAPDAFLGNTPQTVTAMPGAGAAAKVGAGSGGGGGSNPAANYARLLALLGGAGAGIAGLVTSNASPTLPKQVNQALKQVNAGGPNDPNAAYRYDLARAQQAKKLSAEMGPGWATSTPGIQAQQELERTINQDVYSRQLGQQGVGLAQINALTQPLMARQAANAQGLGQLAGTLGTLGYLGLQGSQAPSWWPNFLS